MRHYELAPETYACVVCDGAVLLDLSRDLYLGLNVEQERALAGLVTNWPVPNVSANPSGFRANSSSLSANSSNSLESATSLPASADSASAHAFAESLCQRGLLICDEHANRMPHAPTHLPEAEDELIAWDEMSPKDIRFHHVLAFLRALSIVIAFLHVRSLSALVNRCRRRRQHLRPTPSDPDLARARTLVSAYTHLRALSFSRRGRCLLDSAALMEFLAVYGIHPNWVIGVRRHAPFGAHSWVQQGPWILNGTPAFVRTFVPILVV